MYNIYIYIEKVNSANPFQLVADVSLYSRHPRSSWYTSLVLNSQPSKQFSQCSNPTYEGPLTWLITSNLTIFKKMIPMFSPKSTRDSGVICPNLVLNSYSKSIQIMYGFNEMHHILICVARITMFLLLYED